MIKIQHSNSMARKRLALCVLLTSLLAGCKSGGVVEEPQSAAESGNADSANNEKLYCHADETWDKASARCVECVSSANCKIAEKPICSTNVCIACSEDAECAGGICDEKTGRCLECETNSDCVANNAKLTGLKTDKTLCISNQCVACNMTTCMGKCVDGQCVEDSVKLLCASGNCVYSPITIDQIDTQTRSLANSISILHVDVDDVSNKEIAPFVDGYNVEADVSGLYATVTTEFVIYNPNLRVMEGELVFPLPDDAVVSGYAIDIDNMMMDAQVVEKKQARMAYENEVKRGVDPGLVEQVKGNVYRTRIYPIPARGARRVRVEYTTPLMIAPNGDAALALPMPNTKLSERHITINVAAPGLPAPALGGLGDKRFMQAQAMWVVESHDKDVTPGENVLIAMPSLPETIVSTETFKGDKFFMASIRSVDESSVKAMPKKFRIVWDASGSRTSDDVAKARQFLELLPENASFELHVFRNVLEEKKTINGRDKLLSFLDGLAYDGGTDFSSLKKVASNKFNGITLFFTDGMDTMTNALPQFGANSVAVMTGAARDVSAMRQICAGRTLNLDITQGEDALRQLLKVPPAIAELSGNGFNNVEGLGQSSAGRVTVIGRIDDNASKATLVLSDGKKVSIDIPKSVSEGETLATAWAARRIDKLSPQADENRDELLALGRTFSLVSPVSSMIVFESLEQWLEYDIEPPENSPYHASWLENRQVKSEQDDDYYNLTWQEEFDKLWEMRVAWYNSPKVQFKQVEKQEKPKTESDQDDEFWENDFNDDLSDDEFWDDDLYNPYKSSSNKDLREYCRSWHYSVGSDWNSVWRGRDRGRYVTRAVLQESPQPPEPKPKSRIQFVKQAIEPSVSADEEPVVSGAMDHVSAPQDENNVSFISESTSQHPFAQEPPSRFGSTRNPSRSTSRPSGHANRPVFVAEEATRDEEDNVNSDVFIQEWDPDTPYLTKIADASKIYKSPDSLYKEYLNQRKAYANSPAFYLDCANLFFKENKKELALRILSNLSELKIDDIELLRVYAWRLREAGDYDTAIVVLRKVVDMRPDESISWRDLAFTLTMRAKETRSVKDAQEALDLYHKVAFTSWIDESFREEEGLISISITALEEFNELAAWCKRQGWIGSKITLPKVDPKYMKNFESDLRIVISWDADSTDIDLIITEPSGQNIFYNSQCSLTGGILSTDIMDGYGPEIYMHKYAPKGAYKIYTNYFKSYEQSLIGAATISVTFYSNWGRSNQKSKTVTYRLDDEEENIKVGEYTLK